VVLWLSVKAGWTEAAEDEMHLGESPAKAQKLRVAVFSVSLESSADMSLFV
jgi:hypothetical protein